MARFSLKDRGRSFRYAFQGLWHVLRYEHNFLIHITAAVAVVAAGFYFGITRIEWLVIILCIAGVMAGEIFNTTIEKLVDIIHPEWHSKIGQIKDMAAAAVLVLAAGAAVAGLVIFIPYITNRWG